jgi:hypothetical protein
MKQIMTTEAKELVEVIAALQEEKAMYKARVKECELQISRAKAAFRRAHDTYFTLDNRPVIYKNWLVSGKAGTYADQFEVTVNPIATVE